MHVLVIMGIGFVIGSAAGYQAGMWHGIARLGSAERRERMRRIRRPRD